MPQLLVEDIRKSLLARLELLLDDLDNDASEKECLQLLEESLRLTLSSSAITPSLMK